MEISCRQSFNQKEPDYLMNNLSGLKFKETEELLKSQFEYIDEWETSVSVSPSLLPTSSKYVCMHDFWP